MGKHNKKNKKNQKINNNKKVQKETKMNVETNKIEVKVEKKSNVKTKEVKKMSEQAKEVKVEVKKVDVAVKKTAPVVNFIEAHNKALAYNQQLNEKGTEVGYLWVQFGELLSQIKRGKGYKEPHQEFKQPKGYHSFADYVGSEFSICRQYAYMLICGYKKYQTLSSEKLIASNDRLSEGLLRALPNKMDQVISIWKAARKKAGNAPITSQIIMDCRESGAKTKTAANAEGKKLDVAKIKKSVMKKCSKLSREEILGLIEELKALSEKSTNRIETPVESEKKTA